jgi:hypothetical protein
MPADPPSLLHLCTLTGHAIHAAAWSKLMAQKWGVSQGAAPPHPPWTHTLVVDHVVEHIVREPACLTRSSLLRVLQEVWAKVEFQLTQHKSSDVYLIKLAEEDFETLEDNQVLVQVNPKSSSTCLPPLAAVCRAGAGLRASVRQSVLS